MAYELICNYPGDNTLYALLLNGVGQVYNGSTFESPADANWANYDIALTETQNTELYRGTMPTVAAGSYSFVVRLQSGGSPAVTDIAVAVGSIQWDGTAVSALDSIQTVTDKLSLGADTVIGGTVSTAYTTATTTLFAADDITETTADHYLGRVVIFRNSTDALFGQAARVEGYAWDAVNSEGKFTVSELTEAPSDNDEFVIL